jgi:ParB-like chromosome segregation protein Spo0J
LKVSDHVMVADGQHRLAAVMIAGQPIALLVRMS